MKLQTRKALRPGASTRQHLKLAGRTSVALLALAFTVASCSNKATEEQMKTLAQLDQQRAGLQSDLANAQNALAEQKTKLANAQRDYSDCQNNTSAVTARLATWPNVWPDSVQWRVAPPPPPPAPVEKPHSRHSRKRH